MNSLTITIDGSIPLSLSAMSSNAFRNSTAIEPVLSVIPFRHGNCFIMVERVIGGRDSHGSGGDTDCDMGNTGRVTTRLRVTPRSCHASHHLSRRLVLRVTGIGPSHLSSTSSCTALSYKYGTCRPLIRFVLHSQVQFSTVEKTLPCSMRDSRRSVWYQASNREEGQG